MDYSKFEGVSKILRESVRFNAINGSDSDRYACGEQMREAATTIDQLSSECKRLEAERQKLLSLVNQAYHLFNHSNNEEGWWGWAEKVDDYRKEKKS